MTFEELNQELIKIYEFLQRKDIPECRMNIKLKKTIARAFIYENIIEFSNQFFTMPEEDQKDVLRHEVAHLISKGNHQSKFFKSVCSTLKCNPKATFKVEQENRNYKYEIRCAECGKVVTGYHRKCKGLQGWVSYIEADRNDYRVCCPLSLYKYEQKF